MLAVSFSRISFVASVSSGVGENAQGKGEKTMRISKVKVDKRDVTMLRTAQEGYLRWGEGRLQKAAATDLKETEDSPEISTFLRTEKQDSFYLSVQNKTLIKEVPRPPRTPNKATGKQEEAAWQEKKTILSCLRQIVELALDPAKKCEKPESITALKKLTLEQLKDYFGHKFQKPFLYHTTAETKAKNVPLSVDLAGEMSVALQKANTVQEVAAGLANYQQWAMWYIGRKQALLARSIARNRLDLAGDVADTGTSGGSSRRRLALEEMAALFVQGMEQFDEKIGSLKQAFGLDALCKQWTAQWESYQADYKEKCKEDIPANECLGSQPDLFEFKRSLKQCLQDHQRGLFGDGRNRDNHALNLFSQEVGKYLALYFPLKRSDKKKSTNKGYIDHYLTLKTISVRVRARIINGVTQFQIQGGKAHFYDLGSATPTSETLQNIKIIDTFALKLVNVCAFAAANLRTCLDEEQEGDILVGDVVHSILENLEKDSDEAVRRLRVFFAGHPGGTERAEFPPQGNTTAFYDFVWATRGAVQGIRNAIVHYSGEFRKDPSGQKTIEEILAIKKYEWREPQDKRKTKEQDYSDQAVLRDLLRQEIENLPALFAETLRSTGVFDYYAFEHIEKAITKFSLCPRPLPFIPAFSSVFSLAATYQHNKTYPLGTTFAFKSGGMLKERYEARRNALRMVYTYCFMENFLENKAAFSTAVNKVLEINQEQAEKKQAWAFEEITGFEQWHHTNPTGSIVNYLQDVQGQLILEENKKRKEYEETGKGLSSDQTGHFQKFLWSVFAKGFDAFLSTHKERFGFITRPQEQWGGQPDYEKAKKRNACTARYRPEHIKHDIVSTNGTHIAFWTLCKLLDNRTLNELGNQLSKLAQAQTKEVARTGAKTDVLRQIVSLCLLTADQVPPDYRDRYDNEAQCLKALEPYVVKEIVRKRELPYTQEDRFASVELAKKYATANILEKVLIHHKVSQNDFGPWQRQRLRASIPMKQRQDLHDDWAKAKNEGKTAEKNWFEKHAKEYRDLCTELDTYNWLDNKVNLVHVRDLHQLLIDILGRMVGFVALWERDFRLYNEKLNRQTGETLSLPDDLSIYKFPASRKTMLYSHFLDDACTNPGAKSDGTGKSWKDKRNHIAHLNYLTKSAEGASLLDLLFYVRSLVAYDRKLKNAVAKSFITLLDRHGIIVEFQPLHGSDHRFVIKDIKAKPIKHLGGMKTREIAMVETPARSSEYVDMVRTLLELKT